MSDADGIIDAIDRATNISSLVTGILMRTHAPDADTLPQAIRDRIVIRTALTYLLSHGLLAPGAGSLDDGVSLDLPKLYADSLETVTRDAVDAHMRVMAVLNTGRQQPTT